MKICHIFVQYPHPYQPYNVKLIERLTASGINCFVYSFYKAENKNKLFPFRLFTFFIRGFIKFSLANKIRKAIDKSLLQSLIFVGRLYPIVRFNPAIIHIHHIQVLTPDYIKFFKLLDIPCVVSLRGSDILITPLKSEEEKVLLSQALSFSRGIHTVSNDLRQKALDYGVSSEKISVIRRTPDEIKPITQRPSFDLTPIVITTIGRYHWTKGFVFLLQAIKILVDRKIDVVLNIIGEGKDDEHKELNYWMELLRINSRVKLCGFLNSEQINSILEKTHIYAQPSISEGIPNTLIRVLANKIPVVASNIGGIPEIMHDDCGVLVQPGDSMALVEGIIKIIEDDSFRKSLFSRSSEISFDPAREMQVYRKFYSSILNGEKISSF